MGVVQEEEEEEVEEAEEKDERNEEERGGMTRLQWAGAKDLWGREPWDCNDSQRCFCPLRIEFRRTHLSR